MIHYTTNLFSSHAKKMANMEATPEIASKEEEYTEELWVVTSTKILISSFQQGDHVLN